MIRRHLITFGCVLFLGTAWAIDPEPPFEDPALELTYQALINEVRCLVCQNQTIADSNAPLASDLRREIRQMMGEGASRGEVVEFLVIISKFGFSRRFFESACIFLTECSAEINQWAPTSE